MTAVFERDEGIPVSVLSAVSATATRPKKTGQHVISSSNMPLDYYHSLDGRRFGTARQSCRNHDVDELRSASLNWKIANVALKTHKDGPEE
jgi:hypothetical protein